MPNRAIEEFAQILVRQVRDAAIRDCDVDRRPNAQSVIAKRWRKLGAAEADSVVEAIIPDCVDTALYFLMYAIDQELLRLQYVAEDGTVVDLAGEGLSELAGWYIGTKESWRSKYSEQRFSDFAGTEDENAE